MQISRTRATLTDSIAALKQSSKRIALVPTMGALHAGHLSLVQTAKAHADVVVASIFVNPTQFAPNEDFDTYPRQEGKDVALLEEAGVTLVYLPHREEMYPDGAAITHKAGRCADVLEGEFRPGFFDGVVTVVSRLFEHVQPDMAVFGEKDFQQLFMINQLVEQEGYPIEIIASPTIREADGLAMSSRNAYLSPEERALAAVISKVLNSIKECLETGEVTTEDGLAGRLEKGTQTLLESGFNRVDYLAVRKEENFDPVTKPQGTMRLLAAAWLGTTRLIDNVQVVL